jgi:hypothetical protein
MSIRQNRLAIRLQTRHRRHAKADWGNNSDVFRSPDGDNAGMRERLREPKLVRGPKATGERTTRM